MTNRQVLSVLSTKMDVRVSDNRLQTIKDIQAYFNPETQERAHLPITEETKNRLRRIGGEL